MLPIHVRASYPVIEINLPESSRPSHHTRRKIPAYPAGIRLRFCKSQTVSRRPGG